MAIQALVVAASTIAAGLVRIAALLKKYGRGATKTRAAKSADPKSKAYIVGESLGTAAAATILSFSKIVVDKILIKAAPLWNKSVLGTKEVAQKTMTRVSGMANYVERAVGGFAARTGFASLVVITHSWRALGTFVRGSAAWTKYTAAMSKIASNAKMKEMMAKVGATAAVQRYIRTALVFAYKRGYFNEINKKTFLRAYQNLKPTTKFTDFRAALDHATTAGSLVTATDVITMLSLMSIMFLGDEAEIDVSEQNALDTESEPVVEKKATTKLDAITLGAAAQNIRSDLPDHATKSDAAEGFDALASLYYGFMELFGAVAAEEGVGSDVVFGIQADEQNAPETVEAVVNPDGAFDPCELTDRLQRASARIQILTQALDVRDNRIGDFVRALEEYRNANVTPETDLDLLKKYNRL